MAYEDILIRESTGEGMGQPPWCSACERDAGDCVCEELSDHFRAVCSDSDGDVRVFPAPSESPLQLIYRSESEVGSEGDTPDRGGHQPVSATVGSIPTTSDFTAWLESHGDYLPLPTSFQEWLDRGNDAI